MKVQTLTRSQVIAGRYLFATRKRRRWRRIKRAAVRFVFGLAVAL